MANVPKEKVYDEASMYNAVVGWEPDKYVQLGIESHSGDSIAKMLGAGGPDAEDPAQFTGLWGTFDRSGINRLIRVLRRARDQAFGRDE